MSDLKCSFCLSEDDDRKYLTSDDGTACVCSNCAMMLTQYVLQEKENDTQAPIKDENDKNNLYQDALLALEENWMEKNVINTFIIDCGGTLNEVHFRFKDDDDGYYLVCELEVENIDSLPDDVEENILDEIESAFDEIREGLEEEGLDLDAYLGEKVILNRVN